ncbi:MAG: hypothetical protein HC921_21575 [Synechococcaceae cyanobacterium SM2_3_1]|nr:hypothetical protein [Synechococcaceae cyanobacterium SM2_3_1]
MLSLDIATGILELRAGTGQPTLYVGDVVLGAAGAVPPSRIVGIQPQEGGRRLEFLPALPKEVIERGSASFEVSVDSAWGTPEEGVELENVPTESREPELTPKWEGFRSEDIAIDIGLDSRISGSINLESQYSGSVEFDKDINPEIGLSRFQLDRSANYSAELGLIAEGLYVWRTTTKSIVLGNPDSINFTIPFGPVPVTIKINQIASIEATPELVLYGRANLAGSISGAVIQEARNYDPSQGWISEAEIIGETWVGEIGDGSDFFGTILLATHAQDEIEIIGQRSPSTGIRSYVLGLGVQEGVELQKAENGTSLSGEITGESKIALGGLVTYSQNYPFLDIDQSSVSLNTAPGGPPGPNPGFQNPPGTVNAAPNLGNSGITPQAPTGADIVINAAAAQQKGSVVSQVVNSGTNVAQALVQIVFTVKFAVTTVTTTALTIILTQQPAGEPFNIFEVVPEPNFDEWPEAFRENLIQLRTKNPERRCERPVGDRRNIAYATFSFRIKGTDQIFAGVLRPAVSGEADNSRSRELYTPLPERTFYGNTVQNAEQPAPVDSERKLSEQIANLLVDQFEVSDPSELAGLIEGTVNIYTDQRPCGSCQGVMRALAQDLNGPQVNVKVTTNWVRRSIKDDPLPGLVQPPECECPPANIS